MWYSTAVLRAAYHAQPPLRVMWSSTTFWGGFCGDHKYRVSHVMIGHFFSVTHGNQLLLDSYVL